MSLVQGVDSATIRADEIIEAQRFVQRFVNGQGSSIIEVTTQADISLHELRLLLHLTDIPIDMTDRSGRTALHWGTGTPIELGPCIDLIVTETTGECSEPQMTGLESSQPTDHSPSVSSSLLCSGETWEHRGHQITSRVWCRPQSYQSTQYGNCSIRRCLLWPH